MMKEVEAMIEELVDSVVLGNKDKQNTGVVLDGRKV